MQINKEIDDLIKGFVAGEMTSDHNTAEGFDLVMNYDEDEPVLVRDYYEDGICPDCDNPITEEAVDGDECPNCGHCFVVDEDTKPYTAWEPFENWPDDDFAGAMQNMHRSASALVKACISAMTVDELIEEIRSRKTEKAIIVWSLEDIYGIAKDMGETITEEEATEILAMIEKRHDAEYGVTWETIRFHVARTVEERE